MFSLLADLQKERGFPHPSRKKQLLKFKRESTLLPCYRHALLIRLLGIFEFFPHAGDFLIQQTQKFLVFRLARRLAVEACFAYELQFLPLGLLRVEVEGH